MNTHTVKCCNCNKEIAWWSMFDNIQYEEEWECNNTTIRRKVPKNCQSIKTLKSGKKIRLKYENHHCSISNGSVYCRKCAYKLKFKCKNCKKGKIKLSRKE